MLDLGSIESLFDSSLDFLQIGRQSSINWSKATTVVVDVIGEDMAKGIVVLRIEKEGSQVFCFRQTLKGRGRASVVVGRDWPGGDLVQAKGQAGEDAEAVHIQNL